MRDQQQRSRIALQPVLEPEHGVEVEVVGRLVEQQQVGAAHQRLREIEAHAPAAGEARHRLALPRGAEAQAGQQRRGAGARAVAVDRFEAMMQFGQMLAAMVRVAGRAASAVAAALARPRATRRRRRARSRSLASRPPAFPARRARSPSRAEARTSPASAKSSPRSSANRLDLPLPLAPISPTLWPGWTVSDASSSRRLVPRASVRLLMRSTIRSAAAFKRKS